MFLDILYKLFKHFKLKCLESISIQLLCYCNSHNLCATILLNMIFEHLCTPHIQSAVRSFSLAVNFKHRFNHKDQGGFQCLPKKGTLNIPLHGEVNNYTLDGVSIHPVPTKVQASFLIQLPERKETAQEFHHEANGDFNKTVTEFNGCDRRKLRMDQ